MSDRPWYSPCVKGPVLYCLDQCSRRKDGREILERLRNEIQGLADRHFFGLENVFRDALFVPSETSMEQSQNFADALRNNWFDADSKSAYFKEFQPIAPIYAAGVLKTLELSLAGTGMPKPIDAWWITGFSDVRLFNLVSESQITFMIATPTPEPVTLKQIMGGTGEAWMSSRHGIATERLGPAG